VFPVTDPHRCAIARKDIPKLAHHFRRARVARRRQEADAVTGGLQLLVAHSWPGNVRELQNAIERAVISRTARS
jgi:DNA-binding NtrC family response regulator